MYQYLTTIIFTIGLSLGSAQAASSEVTLLMAEEPGCVWCARWNAEIGPIYPKTGEGQAAPLRRMDITQPMPTDIDLARPTTFTPTFILLIDGVEQNRLEGYPGEDFFWGVLATMLTHAEVPFTVKTASEE
ncbi:MAG: hypothetical protein ACJAXK_003136 [Yoonia sp.]|jgi:hypothetical protein